MSGPEVKREGLHGLVGKKMGPREPMLSNGREMHNFVEMAPKK